MELTFFWYAYALWSDFKKTNCNVVFDGNVILQEEGRNNFKNWRPFSYVPAKKTSNVWEKTH